MSRLSAHLPKDKLKYLFKRVPLPPVPSGYEHMCSFFFGCEQIEKKPVSDWDLQLVNLVREFTIQAYKSYGDVSAERRGA